MEIEAMRTRVAQNLDILRALRGFRSRAALAREVEIDPATFSRLMSGKQKWTLDDIVHIAAVLQVQPHELLNDPAHLVGAVGRVAGGARDKVITDELCPGNGTSVTTKPQVKRRRGSARALAAVA